MIEFPVLYINTCDLGRGICALYNDGDWKVKVIEDSAASIVAEIDILCDGLYPKTVILASGTGSFTGARIGWCVARVLSMIWGCEIWNVERGIPLQEVLRNLEKCTGNGPGY